LPEGKGTNISYAGLNAALAEPNTDIRLFGKPEIDGSRRMGVALSRASTLEEAKETAIRASQAVTVSIEP